jgi:4-carboxymuconolactone decarboxylase
MDHGRLHWYTPSELDEPQRRVYDAITGGPRSTGPQVIKRDDGEGRLYGPFNAMLVDPAVGEAMQSVGAALRYATELPGRQRELAILEVAAFHKSEFEWYAHRQIAVTLGFSEAELDALRTGAEIPGLDEGDRLIRETAHALVERGDLTDGEWAQATAALGVRTVVDLVYFVGYYSALALSMRVFRVGLPPGFEPVFG